MNWNTTDLAKVVMVSAALYAVLRAVFGQPLVRNIINAHRSTWFVVAIAFATTGCGLLREHTDRNNPLAWFDPLWSLVTQDRASGHVLIAAFALLNALVILGAVLFCYWRLPKDPQCFRKRSQLAAAVQYYAALPGGVDFAAIIRLPRNDTASPEVLAIGVNRVEIQERLNATSLPENADDRIKRWIEIASELHHELVSLNTLLTKGGQGLNRRALLDVQYGGYLFQYIRPPDSGDDILFLFAVTVLQQEISNRQFEDHFELMFQAVRNIGGSTERW